MAFDYKYEIEQDSIDRVFDEKGNRILAMRKVAWGDSGKYKLELRRWKLDGETETPDKGFSFLTDEGPHDLTDALVEEGFGNTVNILTSLKERDNFKKSINITMGKESEFFDTNIAVDEEETFYDPTSMDLD